MEYDQYTVRASNIQEAVDDYLRRHVTSSERWHGLLNAAREDGDLIAVTFAMHLAGVPLDVDQIVPRNAGPLDYARVASSLAPLMDLPTLNDFVVRSAIEGREQDSEIWRAAVRGLLRADMYIPEQSIPFLINQTMDESNPIRDEIIDDLIDQGLPPRIVDHLAATRQYDTLQMLIDEGVIEPGEHGLFSTAFGG